MKNDIIQLFENIGLNEGTLDNIEFLDGGRQHLAMKATFTDGKAYVVKKLHEKCWLGDYTYDYFDHVENLAAIVNKHLTCTVNAYFSNNRRVHNIKGDFYVVMPWLEGYIKQHLSMKQCGLMGELLASLHNLQLSSDIFIPFKPLVWQCQLPREIHHFDAILSSCNKALSKYHHRHVLSHRDINLTNVIWQSDDKPVLIDWESTGYIHPIVELIGLGLNCSGIELLEMNWDKFQNVINAYKPNYKQESQLEPDAYDQVYYSWLAWLHFCMENKEPHTIEIEREVAICQHAIKLLQHNKDKILSYFN